MVGGGNLVRGAEIAGHGIHRVTADHMGMLATMINALALTDIFESEGLTTRCLVVSLPNKSLNHLFIVWLKNILLKAEW